MRITTVIEDLGGGGAERVCVNLANAWVARGWDVTILTVSQRAATPAYAIDSRVRMRDIGWRRSADPKELNALEIYGDGPSHESLTELIHELAPGSIQLRGFTDTPYAVLGGADLFVSSSWLEAFGNAIWEALACGVPVVALECGASVRSLVRDGVEGLIVEGDNPYALASALASLMGDVRARRTMAARAPEVVTRFSIESALKAWDALLRNVSSPE
jgi:glycosyltransferase involved in cell wall biosynthesis